MAAIFEQIKEIVVAKLGIDESDVSEESSLKYLGADSLDEIEILMELEYRFSAPGKELKISDEEAERIETIREMLDCLEKKGIVDE